MGFKKISFILLIVAVVGGGFSGWWFLGQSPGTAMPVFTAGSLAMPFKELETVFEAQNPDVNVRRETWGSATMIRQVTELGKKADIIASSDYSIILPMMEPGGYADW